MRFSTEIKATIEIGHANHLANEVSSVAYWYAEKPTRVVDVPAVEQRLPIRRDNAGKWQQDPQHECHGKPTLLTDEMKDVKANWAENHKG